MDSRRTAGIAAVLLAAVAFVYWPVIHGNFVWDDEIDFLKYDWLTRGDQWKHYIFRDFHGWNSYFRPLVVALFTLQLRVFDISPGPMHIVSLTVHLTNTLLVGMLAIRSSEAVGQNARSHTLPMAISMLVYGLHPAQIEPVAWIASQFDLFATLFMLLGLLANARLHGNYSRPATVGVCFFLAACSKESAATFPLLLGIMDWGMTPTQHGATHAQRIRDFFARNARTYAAVLVAGLVYLAFRYWALGLLTAPAPADGPSLFGSMQTACFLYLRYALMVLAPTVGMGPLHPFEPSAFEQATLSSIAIDVSALAILLTSLWFALSRRSVPACIALALAAAVMPVLRIVPSTYENELYCARYLMTGLAVVCAMLPLLSLQLPASLRRLRPLRPAVLAIGLSWMVMSAITIRATLPMWADSISLWQWALTIDPTSGRAANALLIAYADRGLSEEARTLSNQIVARRIVCFNCMLTTAEVALRERDLPRARQALIEATRVSHDSLANDYMRQRFHVLTAHLQQLEARSHGGRLER